MISLPKQWLPTNIQIQNEVKVKKCNGTAPVESIVKQGDHFMCLKCSTTIKHQNIKVDTENLQKYNSEEKKILFVKCVEKNLIYSLNLMNIKRNILTSLVTTVFHAHVAECTSIFLPSMANSFSDQQVP